MAIGKELNLEITLRRKTEGMEQFLDGQYEVERCQTISCEDAMACAKEFFETQQRSKNIKWDAHFE